MTSLSFFEYDAEHHERLVGKNMSMASFDLLQEELLGHIAGLALAHMKNIRRRNTRHRSRMEMVIPYSCK